MGHGPRAATWPDSVWVIARASSPSFVRARASGASSPGRTGQRGACAGVGYLHASPSSFGQSSMMDDREDHQISRSESDQRMAPPARDHDKLRRGCGAIEMPTAIAEAFGPGSCISASYGLRRLQ
jgi:hypothetical protein